MADRQVLSTDEHDPVAAHARSLGVGFSGPTELASALRAVDVTVPFDSTAGATTSEAGASEPETGPGGGLLSRLSGVLLAVLVLTLALGAAGLLR